MRTPDEIREIVQAAEKSCRCDGGNTMGCAACVAERQARTFTTEERYIAQAYITFDACLNPPRRNRRHSPRVSDLTRIGWQRAGKPRYIMHVQDGKMWNHKAGEMCSICDRRNNV